MSEPTTTPESPAALTLRDREDSLEIVVDDVAIATYVVDPHAPKSESPKPYLHPIRTLSGAPLSVYRPWDHRWHKGLQLTLSEVSGENFWGGPTFTPEDGYVWKDNLGTIAHVGFRTSVADPTAVVVGEDLDWTTAAGQRWFTEERTQRFHSVDPGRGLWAYDFTTTLTNVSGRHLDLGSPTTLGRPSAGYTGLFWRGPRSWTGARITADGLDDAQDPMGHRGAWLALASQHDEIDGGATVLAIAGSSSADVPLTWFVRSEPFAAIAPSPAFDQEVALDPGAQLSLAHRFVFVDHVCERDELRRLGEEFAL